MDEKALEAAAKAAYSSYWSDDNAVAFIATTRLAVEEYLRVSGVEQDAERYRWIREMDVEIYDAGGGKLISAGFLSGELDEIVDEARKP